MIARWVGHQPLKRLLGERIELRWLGSQNALMGMVFVSRLMPFLSFDLVSYGAGLTPLRLWRFVIATFAGLIPSSFLLAHIGGELTTTERVTTLTTLLWLGLLTLIPFIAKAIWDWHQRRSAMRQRKSPFED